MSDLPEGWEWATPDQVAARERNALAIGPFGSNLKVADYRSEGVPLVFVRNIRTNAFGRADLRFVSPDKAESLRAHQVRHGDLLVTKMGDPPGDSAIYPLMEPGIITADCIKLTAHPSVDMRYLMYAIRSPQVQRQIAAITQGVAQRKVSLDRFRKRISIPLAPPVEQARIVAAIEEQFSCLDVGLAALYRAHANANRLEARILSAVSRGVDSWITLGEIADVTGGVTKDVKKQSDPSLVEVPYLRVANVQRGYLDLRQVASIRVPHATAQKLLLEPGDILFNEGGDRDKLGRGWVWEGQVPGCIHQNHVFRARLQGYGFDPKFISMHGNTFGRSWFEKMGKQTTNLASLNLKTLKSFPVPKMPLREQREVVAETERKLSELGALNADIATAIRRTSSLRSSILASAFSGELT
jgi:type I restriction enzyme S subunit